MWKIVGLVVCLGFELQTLGAARAADTPACDDAIHAGTGWLFGSLAQLRVDFAVPFCTDPVVVATAESQDGKVTLHITQENRLGFNLSGCLIRTGEIICPAPAAIRVKVHWIATSER